MNEAKIKKNAHQLAQVLGVKLRGRTKREVLEKVDSWLSQGKKFYITTPNPEIIVQAQKDEELKLSINNSDLSIVDGVGLKIALIVASGINYRVIKGRDLFVDLLKIANERGYKIYLLGSTNRVIKESIAKILRNYPNINIQGNDGPRLDSDAKPVTKLDTKIYKDTLRDINLFKPDFLFVAFGAPKQEKWVFENFKDLKVYGVMVIGGTLDYFSGEVKLPPEILSNIGLEWVWRLLHEPQRFGRIFKAVVLFPLMVLKNRFMI